MNTTYKKTIDTELIEYILNYEEPYGSLWISPGWQNKDQYYVKERYYPGIEVDWTVKGGPFTFDEAKFIILSTGIKVWGSDETKRKFYVESI